MRRGRPIAPLTLTQEEQATLEQREISGDRIFHFPFLPFRQPPFLRRKLVPITCSS